MILGDGAVGKTSIIQRFASDSYAEQHVATLGLDFCPQKHTTTSGITSNIKIWDTAGQERFKQLTYNFYKKAEGIIICFDLTDKNTYENVQKWIEGINTHCVNE